MTRQLALVRISPEEIAYTFHSSIGRIDLPGTDPISTVHAPHDGWRGMGFRIAAVRPADPIPPDRIETSRLVNLIDGEPVEVILTDTPSPLAPREPTRAQAESALFHYRLADGSDPGYFDQYEALIQNHPYAPVRIWAKGATVWREDHPYIWALALDMKPPISEAEMVKLFDAAMTFEA